MLKIILSIISLLVTLSCLLVLFLRRPEILFEVNPTKEQQSQPLTRTLYMDGELEVYIEDYETECEIGKFVTLLTRRDAEELTYHDLSYTVVSGRDCGAVYFDGSMRGLGTGQIIVKVWLDNDPSVYGYGRMDVIQPKDENSYTVVKKEFDQTIPMDSAFEQKITAFPDSYKPALRRLHNSYPSWTFLPFFTGLDFSDALYNESLGDRNVTLATNFADIIKRKEATDIDPQTLEYIYKDTGWISVNRIGLSYFMDPRNFLDEVNIFQFELLKYDSVNHTLDGVQKILIGSYMEDTFTSYYDRNGDFIETDETYAEVIFEAGRLSGVSPYFLASKIRHEIGTPPSRAATGLCPGYEGLYNLYNIGATDGEGNIERGLAWAGSGESFQRPWITPARSIIGGAYVIAEDYVNTGQYTSYLQKFNLNPESSYSLYTHQYMTNVSGAAALGQSFFTTYDEIGILNSPLTFSIPVFSGLTGDPENPAQSISVESDGAAYVSSAVYLRSGPGAYYTQVDGIRLQPGTCVTVKEAVICDAAFYANWLFYPVWYQISIQQDDKTVTGFVSAEFVRRTSKTVLTIGEEYPLSAGLFPGKASDRMYYLSENSNVASVSDDGTVTAIGPGRVTIIAFTSLGLIDTISLTVYDSSL